LEHKKQKRSSRKLKKYARELKLYEWNLN